MVPKDSVRAESPYLSLFRNTKGLRKNNFTVLKESTCSSAQAESCGQ